MIISMSVLHRTPFWKICFLARARASQLLLLMFINHAIYATKITRISAISLIIIEMLL